MEHKIKFNAKYKCKNCFETWKTKNTSNLKMICKNRDCRQIVRAYKFEVINKLVVYQCGQCLNKIKKTKCSSEVKEAPYCTICQNDMKVCILKDLWRKKRMFGTFYCDECHNKWQSGYAWDGVGQDCINCRIMILPHTLEPLKITDTSVRKGRPHREDLCEMCKQLGHPCKNYKPTTTDIAQMEEIPFEEDTQSVITTNSSVVGDDDDDDNDDHSTSGGDRTPINSDDDLSEKDDMKNVQEMFSKMSTK